MHLRRFFLLLACLFSLQLLHAATEADSTIRIYHDNGKLKVKATMKDGSWDGIMREYDEEGRLRIKIKYKKGEKRWEQHFNEKGRLIEVIDRKGKVRKLKDCNC